MTPSAPSAPAVEHVRDALGIGRASPRLSWRNRAAAGWMQRRYEIELRAVDGSTRTRQIASGDSVLAPWPFEPLDSRARVAVRVRVAGDDARWSPWSPITELETGLLEADDWRALAIRSPWPEQPDSERRPPLLRREFAVRPGLVAARLYATAHGVFELELNGRTVGDEVLAPGWTSYHQRLGYRTHDVTGLLRAGANAIGAWLGDGWYRGRLGWNGGTRDVYGEHLALLAQLELHYGDGTTETIATDGSWRAATGPILRSSLYDGETFDRRALPEAWSLPGFDDAGWTPVIAEPFDRARLFSLGFPPVRCTAELAPVAVTQLGEGRRLLDFGQNASGRLRLDVRAAAGTEIVVRHAEVTEHGELATRPLRDAEATDRYIAAGLDDERWEPRFTMHGFRYAELAGPDAALDATDAVHRVHHTDMTRTGWFRCSDPELQQLHDNIVWTMRSNFVSLPTDCPQRDERFGWTGDAQIFTPTAAYLYDCAGLLASWLEDLAHEQHEDGLVPWYVPWVPTSALFTPPRPAALWGDAAVLMPWELYWQYGDRDVLERQAESARRWVDLVEGLAGPDRRWDTGFQLGDWLDPTAPPSDPTRAMTDPHLVATAYFAHSAATLARIEAVLGRDDDAVRYRGLAAEIRAAFRATHLLPDGRARSETQTAYALAIAFGLLEEPGRRTAGARLAALVAAGGHRIGTGFAGTPVILDALSSTGSLDAAYALLLQSEPPSWLYAVRQGATTVWERWDSMLPDGTVNPGAMTSFNHYAFGAVADWMHRVIGGLAPGAAGWRRLRVAPRPGGGLTSAATAHDTPYGRAAVAWSRRGDRLDVEVEVPTGTSARLSLPGLPETEVGPGEHRFTASAR